MDEHEQAETSGIIGEIDVLASMQDARDLARVIVAYWQELSDGGIPDFAVFNLTALFQQSVLLGGFDDEQEKGQYPG